MREHKYTTQKEIEQLREELKAEKLKGIHPARMFTSAKIASFSVFLVVLIVLFGVLISVLVSKYRGETPQIFGYQFYSVKSASMSPTLKVGSVILSKIPMDASVLEVGDIVTFKHEDAIITHRIIEVIKKDNVLYRTKGDNPDNSPDTDLLLPENVKAVFVLKLY